MSATLFAIFIAVLLFVVILSPFYWSSRESLVSTKTYTNLDELISARDLLLDRYVQEYNFFKNGELSKEAWKRRSRFLDNCFIDMTRRIDFIQSIGASNND